MKLMYVCMCFVCGPLPQSLTPPTHYSQVIAFSLALGDNAEIAAASASVHRVPDNNRVLNVDISAALHASTHSSIGELTRSVDAMVNTLRSNYEELRRNDELRPSAGQYLQLLRVERARQRPEAGSGTSGQDNRYEIGHGLRNTPRRAYTIAP